MGISHIQVLALLLNIQIHLPVVNKIEFTAHWRWSPSTLSEELVFSMIQGGGAFDKSKHRPALFHINASCRHEIALLEGLYAGHSEKRSKQSTTLALLLAANIQNRKLLPTLLYSFSSLLCFHSTNTQETDRKCRWERLRRTNDVFYWMSSVMLGFSRALLLSKELLQRTDWSRINACKIYRTQDLHKNMNLSI